MALHVTVYTRSGCEHCRLLKEYLDDKGVAYQERDIQQDQAAARELQALHAPGVPVTVIDGQAVLGFDKVRLDDLLQAKGVPITKPR